MLLTHALRAATPGTSDSNFKNVILLLHGDGTNGGQNNTFVDSSANNFTVTRNGNVTQGTFSPYGNNWSNHFDGTGDWLSVPNNAVLQLPTQDFTIECWIYLNVLPAAASAIVQKGRAATGNVEYLFRIVNSSGTCFLSFQASSSGTAITDTLNDTTTSIVVGQWYHVAVTRTGANIALWVNGTNVASSTTFSTTYHANTAVVAIGANDNAAGPINGYISNFRFVKGDRVYTTAFTPSTVPLTAIANTSLLTCQSYRFVDNSSNSFTITRNGDVSVQKFNPFPLLAEYSSGVNGGSCYFDGTGDYLSLSGGMPSGQGTAFTMECWIYLSDLSNYRVITRGTAGSQFDWGVNTSGAIVLDDATVVNICKSANSTIVPRNWYHVAVTRTTGNIYTIYVNGVSVATSSAYNTSMTATTTIGYSSFSGSHYFIGYMSDFRSTNSLVYSGNFTPPATPLEAITNTTLLCNFTNASVIDHAMLQISETVGNAQINTSTKKISTGSLAFDGTGDWLLMPHTVDQMFHGQNFTIELYVYLSATGVAYGLVSKGTATTGWMISINTSNQVVFTYASSTITSTGTLAASTWYHIAVVREGTGTNQTKIYIDGSNDGTGTVSTVFTSTQSLYVGADRTGGSALNGYIDELRITKGVARYAANFTAPVVPFFNK